MVQGGGAYSSSLYRSRISRFMFSRYDSPAGFGLPEDFRRFFSLLSPKISLLLSLLQVGKLLPRLLHFLLNCNILLVQV